MKHCTFQNVFSNRRQYLALLQYITFLHTLCHAIPAPAEWHGELSFLTDYLYRGYSKNRSAPLLQGHIDYQDTSGWFAGVSLSQISFDDQSNLRHADLEIKPYLGWSLPISDDWRGELSVSGYIYDDQIFAHDAHYAEFYTSLHFQDWLTGRISVAPDAYQRHATVINYELNYRRDIFDTLQFSTGLGYYQAGSLLGQDYFYWNTGISWFATSNLALDIRYVDVRLNEHHDSGAHHDEFYPRPLENKYLLSVTLGF